MVDIRDLFSETYFLFILFSFAGILQSIVWIFDQTKDEHQTVNGNPRETFTKWERCSWWSLDVPYILFPNHHPEL